MIMEVSIISRETIKPSSSSSSSSSSPSPVPHKPFKISLLDQVTPATYVPCIFFYPPPPSNNIDQASENAHILFSTKLKASLSETLARFYPFSGRHKDDNLFIDNFHEGVPYLKARVSCKMSEFLNDPNLSSLNKFLPRLPFRNHSSDDPKTLPQLEVQESVFSCGGVAIGTCMSHKISDASTGFGFFNCWANIANGENKKHEVADDDFLALSSRFPAVDLVPEFYTSMYENIWFGQANCKTERFVFDEEAIATLKARARSELVENPSRLQALSGFIWKSSMAASRAASSTSTTTQSPRTSVMCQAVNLRREPQGKPRVGNLFWWSVALHNEDAATAEERDLAGLVERGFESVADTKDYYMNSLKEDGAAFSAIGGHLKLLEEMYRYEDPDIYAFTSWVNMGLGEIDFGWGKPLWVGTFGEVGSVFRNLTVLIESAWGRGIEAWITLDEKVLAELGNNPEFLAFASTNPPIPYSKP